MQQLELPIFHHLLHFRLFYFFGLADKFEETNLEAE